MYTLAHSLTDVEIETVNEPAAQGRFSTIKLTT